MKNREEAIRLVEAAASRIGNKLANYSCCALDVEVVQHSIGVGFEYSHRWLLDAYRQFYGFDFDQCWWWDGQSDGVQPQGVRDERRGQRILMLLLFAEALRTGDC